MTLFVVFVQGSSIIPLSRQVEQFAAVQRNISSRVGNAAAANTLLSRSLFLVSTGGNDLFAFFSRNQNSTPSDADKKQFVANLVALYQNHVKVRCRRGAAPCSLLEMVRREISLRRNVCRGRRRFNPIRLCTCSGRGS